MKTCKVDDKRIWKVWNWCLDSYLRHNIRLSFPDNTDPQKTYQWRYCRSLAEKIDGWEFDDETAIRFIDLTLKHVKSSGPSALRKGMAIFHQKNMLEIVYKRLQKENQGDAQSIDSLADTNKWLLRMVDGDDTIGFLMRRKSPDALCNLAMWHQANKIPSLYIALSKSCSKALARLKKSGSDDCNFLPKATQLYLIRANFQEDTKSLKEARKILGEDWRRLCH